MKYPYWIIVTKKSKDKMAVLHAKVVRKMRKDEKERLERLCSSHMAEICRRRGVMIKVLKYNQFGDGESCTYHIFKKDGKAEELQPFWMDRGEYHKLTKEQYMMEVV